MDMVVQDQKNIPCKQIVCYFLHSVCVNLCVCVVELAGAAQPVKLVKSLADVQMWLHSEAYYDLVGFINGISTAIQGKKCSSDYHISPAMKKLMVIFEKLNAMIDATPPIDQPQRFGNSAFRAWSRKMNHVRFYGFITTHTSLLHRYVHTSCRRYL